MNQALVPLPAHHPAKAFTKYLSVIGATRQRKIRKSHLASAKSQCHKGFYNECFFCLLRDTYGVLLL